MKKFLVFIMLAASSLSYAEGVEGGQLKEKPVYCFKLQMLLDNIKKNYGEELDFFYANQMYRDYVTQIAMMRNKSTGSWTLIEYDNERTMGCVIASGKNNPL